MKRTEINDFIEGIRKKNRKVNVAICLFCVFLSACSSIDDISKINSGGTYYVGEKINLQGKCIILPSNCRLVGLNTGIIENGTIQGTNSSLEGISIRNIVLKGTFETIDIELKSNVDYLNVSVAKTETFKLDGHGNKIRNASICQLKDADVVIRNASFDCEKMVQPLISTIGNSNNSFKVQNCRFENIPEISLISARKMMNPQIENCHFEGLLNTKSVRKNLYLPLIRYYECFGNVVFSGNTITNCFGIAFDGIGFSKASNTRVRVLNNMIKCVSNGGIVFNGGEVHNVVVSNNKISQTHFLGSTFPEEVNGAVNSAINFHGFNNLKIKNNTIEDCPNSSSLDIDGTATNTDVQKGRHLVVMNNQITDCGNSYYLGVQDAWISHNTFIFSISGNQNLSSGIIINASSNFRFTSNTIRTYGATGTSFCPIIIRQNTNRMSGEIYLRNNMVYSDGNNYLSVYRGFTGRVNAKKNRAISIKTNGPLKWVNNAGQSFVKSDDVNIYH